MVGERGFEPPTPWSRTGKLQNPKCFAWCRLGAGKPFFLLPSIVPILYRESGSVGHDLDFAITAAAGPSSRLAPLCSRCVRHLFAKRCPPDPSIPSPLSFRSQLSAELHNCRSSLLHS